MVPSWDGDVEKKAPPTFKVPKKLKAKGATEADLSEVDGVREYKKFFSANEEIYCFLTRFLEIYLITPGNNALSIFVLL